MKNIIFCKRILVLINAIICFASIISAQNNTPIDSNELSKIYESLKVDLCTEPLDNPYADNVYAVILNGGANPKSNFSSFWCEMSYIYQSLTKRYSIPKDHIIPQPLDLDNDNVPEIELGATKENLEYVFSELLNKMKTGDLLFLFVTGHGEYRDEIAESTICLWRNVILNEYSQKYELSASELKNMLDPFVNNSIFVNCVLSQCHSGGFNEVLNREGYVVTSSVPDYASALSALSNYTFSPFSGNWIDAISGITPNEEIIDADYDRDGKVSMSEVSTYLKSLKVDPIDAIYSSNPVYLGKELALNHIPDPSDLYIKDNDDDLGDEPNITNHIEWISGDIWFNNENSIMLEHQSPDLVNCKKGYVNVNINNKGPLDYRQARYLTIYWDLGSFGNSSDFWKGNVYVDDLTTTYDDNIPLGGIVGQYEIPFIPNNSELTITAEWVFPEPLKPYFQRNNYLSSSIGFYALISNGLYDVENTRLIDKETILDRDILKYNDCARQNEYKIETGNMSKWHSCYPAVFDNIEETFSLEIHPVGDVNIKDGLIVSLLVALPTNIVLADEPINPIFTSSNRPKLKGYLLDKDYPVLAGLKFKDSRHLPLLIAVYFNAASDIKDLEGKIIKFDLIQKDKNDRILGGQRFVLNFESTNKQSLLARITYDNVSDCFLLESSEDEKSNNISWSENDNTIIGIGNELQMVAPAGKQQIYTSAIGEDGDIKLDSIILERPSWITKLCELNNSSNQVEVYFQFESLEGDRLIICKLQNPINYGEIEINPGSTKCLLDLDSFESGYYSISYLHNGIVVDNLHVRL